MVVGEALAKHAGFGRQQLVAAGDDPTRPALLLLPPPSAGRDGMCLRLLLTLPPDAFSPSKLAPDRNNVRWLASPAGALGAAAAGGAVPGEPRLPSPAGLLPSPHYNAALLADALAVTHARGLAAAGAAMPGMAAGVRLLKVRLAVCTDGAAAAVAAGVATVTVTVTARHLPPAARHLPPLAGHCMLIEGGGMRLLATTRGRSGPRSRRAAADDARAACECRVGE